MNTLIILAHPEPRSFNAHLAAVARNTFLNQGDEVRVSDLYAMAFDPAEAARHYPSPRDPVHFNPQAEQRHGFENRVLPSDVQSELKNIEWAGLVIFQFPLWWFGMPAILKGWMDRVFVYGGLYSGNHRHDTGPCRGKRALMSVTTGSSVTACAHNGMEGETRLILWPSLYALRYVGFSVLQPLIIHGVHAGYNPAQAVRQSRNLKRASREFSASLQNIDAIPEVPFNTREDWDGQARLKPQSPVYSPFIRHRKDLELV